MKVLPRHWSYTAKTTSFKSIVLFVGDAKEVVLIVNVTSVSGTAPTLDVDVLEVPAKEGGTPSTVEVSLPAECYREGSKMPQFTAVGTATRHLISFSPYIRVNYIIGGTTPSFDFDVYLSTR